MITVVGVGGGAVNALDGMIRAGMQGVEFVAVDTDAAALSRSRAAMHIQLGEPLTQGLAAGGDPHIGSLAARHLRERLRQALDGADLLFIVAGMGGGTGGGSAPIVAEIAREASTLTVGVVTRPFRFEGTRRRRAAEAGIAALQSVLDFLIIVPNDRLLRTADSTMTMAVALTLADDAIRMAVGGISSTITAPGPLPVALTEARRLLATGRRATVGIGRASGPDRAVAAAMRALQHPLLELSECDANDLLYTFAGADYTVSEVAHAAATVAAAAGDKSAACLGTALDRNLGSEVQVTVLAPGAPGIPDSGSHLQRGPSG